MNVTLKSLTVALALGVSTLAAQADVVVSSKIDTEGSVLGNIILLALNANGIKTQDRVQLGATSVVRKAITAGEIDIYPEYTGNAGFFFNKADDPLWKDAAKGLRGGQETRLRRQQDRLARSVAGQQHLGDCGAQGRGGSQQARHHVGFRQMGRGRRAPPSSRHHPNS